MRIFILLLLTVSLLFIWWKYDQILAVYWDDCKLIDDWKWDPYWDCWELDEAVVVADAPKKCEGIKLNTNFPIIWDCINIKKGGEGTDVTQAFPTMIWALTKIIISIILVVCFIMIIVAWIMRASSWDKATTKAKSLIIKVAVTVLLLWFSWVILKLINPNFFS